MCLLISLRPTPLPPMMWPTSARYVPRENLRFETVLIVRFYRPMFPALAFCRRLFPASIRSRLLWPRRPARYAEFVAMFILFPYQ